MTDLSPVDALTLFGPDTLFACDSEFLIVACGSECVEPGWYVPVWIQLREPVPQDDDAHPGGFRAMFRDSNPENDFVP